MFKTHNDSIVSLQGTSLVGVIDVSYSKLIETFGKPTSSDEYKSDAEWEILFDDGTVATIYNWKDGKNYCGADGLNVEDISHWHVGGLNNKALELVKEVLA